MSLRPKSMTEPTAAGHEPVVHERFGVRWVDEFAWLRDPAWPDVRDPAILAHLALENARFAEAMAPRQALVERLHAELRGRIAADDASVPAREGGFEYWWHYRPDEEYRRWLRRALPGGEPMVILDENLLARDRGYFALRSLAPSPDGKLLAYATDEDGSERFALHLEDIDGGTRLADLVTNTTGSIVWAEDGRTLLYVELDAHLRPWRVRAHRLGSDPAGDAELFSERDPAFFLSIGKTLDHRLLLIVSGTNESRETWLLDAEQPLGEPRLVAPRRNGHRYSVDHAHGRLWIRTDDRHPNFRLVSAPVGDPGEASWREEIPADDRTYLVEHECFADFCVLRSGATGGRRARALLGRCRARGRFRRGGRGTVHRRQSRVRDRPRSLELQLDGDAADGARLRAARAAADRTQGADHSHRLRAGGLCLRNLVGDGAGRRRDPDHAAAPARSPAQGAAVPLRLRRLRHGLDASFSISRLSLVDRGFVYAIAHVRGGDEKGRRWFMPASARRSRTASPTSSPAPST